MDQATIWQAVQAWPAEEQRAFAERLLDGLDGEVPEIDDELAAELDRRCADADAHPEKLIPWEQVLEKLRRKS